MKRLLTFIYGLLLFALGMTIVKYYFFEFEHWFRWVNLIIAISITTQAIDKLDKATEE